MRGITFKNIHEMNLVYILPKLHVFLVKSLKQGFGVPSLHSSLLRELHI